MKLENYRHYLQNEFEKRKVRNPHYSLRAFARDLGASPSRISEAINGKRGISLKLASQLIQKLGIEGYDAQIFRLSVEAEHSRSQLQKNQAQEKLQQALSAPPEQAPKTITMVDWVAEALLKMNDRELVADQVEKVSDKLGLPQFMVVHSLRFLTRLGLIKGAKNFKTYLANRGQGRRLNVDYTQILEQAQKAYALNGFSQEGFQHQAFLLEKKDLARAQKILLQSLLEIQKLEKKTKSSKVVFVANQIFSVEKEGN